MMRSLYAAISGLRNHQVKMDVIGNNIANVNTVGFKSGSVTFQDMLSQTLSGASSGNGTTGGTNPMQVGLGVSTAAISTNFTDGSAQSTGVQTDLAISGQGFFVLGDALNQVYSRSGNFTFDASGNLVVPGTGMKVLGWRGDSSGVVNTTSPIQGITIPIGSSMPAKVSSKLTMSGNLSASATAIGTPVQQAAADAAKTKADADKLTADNENTLAATAKTKADTAAASAAKAKLSAAAAKVAADAADAAASAIPSTLTAAMITTAQSTAKTAKDDAKTAKDNADLAATAATAAAAAGVGSDVDALAAQGAAATAFNDANTAYGSINALTVTSTAAAIHTAALDVGAAALSTATADSKATTAATTAAGTATAAESKAAAAAKNVATAAAAVEAAYNKTSDQPGSLNVYDSQGNAYKLNGTFEKTGDNVWSFTPASTITDAKGNTVANVSSSAPISITFNASGAFQASTASTITVNPAGGPYAGAGSFTITPDFSTMTQYGTDTTAKIDNTDGYTAGTLTAGGGITISTDGTIVGTFTNGKKMDLGKIAMATFNNPGGLMKEGNSLYSASSNSGTPSVGTAGTGGRGKLTPGSLEMSNVDLAQQFSDMIVTQRGFQANSKIITTDDSMLEELVNLKR